MNYDFSQLNDKEFEILVADLLSLHFDTHIERFKSGRDGGVDGRFYSNKNDEIILQCKHYLKTGYRGLISKLTREEAQKVNKLAPAKYIFITSLPLSRDNKKEIKTIFNPYIKKAGDIFGQEDLNDLLSKHPRVEEKHYKLWISSTVVFNRIINNAIKGRSEYELEQIQKKTYRYVQTETYSQALDILKTNHVLIISGEPGIGKTTLAENICLHFVSKDYEFISIEESLSEAENIYARGKKQIFYFDDFLGSNYFEAIENKKDSHIIKFIERVKSDNTKLFVLTSRTTILNSGILHSSIFANKSIEKNEFLLTIKSLTQMDRAKILYNHIWFSDLTEEFIDKIYENKRYTVIIEHKNYYPRLIEFITDVSRISTSNSDDYWKYIEETLQNPKDIWDNCFKIQNNAFVRGLVNLTVFNGGQITENAMRAGFNQLIQRDILRNTSNTEKDFNSTSRLATKSFLKRQLGRNEVIYSLFNPSISDYVLSEFCQDIERLTAIYKALGTVQSLRNLVSLGKENVIAREYIIQLKNSVFEEALNNEDRNYDYLIFISDLIHQDNQNKDGVTKLLNRIINSPAPIAEISKFLSLLTDYHEDVSLLSGDYNFLFTAIHDRYLDEYEIYDLAKFLTVFNINDANIISKLKEDLESFIKDTVKDHSTDLDLSEFIQRPYFDEYGCDFDSDGIQAELFAIANSTLEDLDLDGFSRLDISVEEIKEIVGDVDIDEIVSEYLKSQREMDYDDFDDESININQDTNYLIDDLFERL